MFWSLLAVASTALEDPAITESQQKIQPSLLSEFVQVFSSGQVANVSLYNQPSFVAALSSAYNNLLSM